MGTLLGGAVVDRGLFDPAHVNEAAVFAIWACIVASAYLAISLKHSPGKSCTVTVTCFCLTSTQLTYEHSKHLLSCRLHRLMFRLFTELQVEETGCCCYWA